MFEQDSRYDAIETALYEMRDGRRVPYKRRRFLPHGEAMPLLREVTVGVEDRLDRIAARALGHAEAFWQICDANNAMNPADLDRTPGSSLRVPVPQFPEDA